MALLHTSHGSRYYVAFVVGTPWNLRLRFMYRVATCVSVFDALAAHIDVFEVRQSTINARSPLRLLPSSAMTRYASPISEN